MSVKYFEVELSRVIDVVKSVLERFDWIEIAVVFGSSLRRRVVRDVDIGIVAGKPIGLEELNEVASELEKVLRVSVDVVPLDEAPPLLRFKALSEGIRAINRNPLRLHYMLSEAFMEVMDMKLAVQNSSKCFHDF
jgi:predicted nucleotidyltransferase